MDNDICNIYHKDSIRMITDFEGIIFCTFILSNDWDNHNMEESPY